MSLTRKGLCIRAAVTLTILAIALVSAVVARADETYTVSLPLLAGGGAPADSGPPQGGSLPQELVGTWYSGQVLNRQLYNRESGLWSDPGGLGHMYSFAADGSYVLASYLKLGEGTLCVSTVWKYHTGKARVEGQSLALTPSYARTRTQISCGGNSDTETEGPLRTSTMPWLVGEDEQGHTRLQLTEAQGETLYYKDGLAPQVLGGWRSGDLRRAGFYDPASGAWGEPTGEGEWYYFGADGRYQRGQVRVEFGTSCQQAVLLYEEGELGGKGADITLLTTRSLRRSVDLCDQSQVRDETLEAGRYERWTWALRQAQQGAILDLLRIEGGFRQSSFERDE